MIIPADLRQSSVDIDEAEVRHDPLADPDSNRDLGMMDIDELPTPPFMLDLNPSSAGEATNLLKLSIVDITCGTGSPINCTECKGLTDQIQQKSDLIASEELNCYEEIEPLTKDDSTQIPLTAESDSEAPLTENLAKMSMQIGTVLCKLMSLWTRILVSLFQLSLLIP
ncbi:hypothetical protein QAD02_013650 [Eretmocerus hayati]|uniref:Uncharacterized protein n=1 Tax=Eretmocerus hayati TaxID=131215 RepID=A0ACC2P422_9HYME|nr:hypothetical protein QAD02_013650 [Eretmocerus hayati]